ncbi:hypothetical protein [Vibrio sp. PNB22_4_1]
MASKSWFPNYFDMMVRYSIFGGPFNQVFQWQVEILNHDTKRVKKRWEKALQGIEVQRETHNERQAKGTVFLYYASNEKNGKDDIATKSTRTLWSAVYLCYVMAND